MPSTLSFSKYLKYKYKIFTLRAVCNSQLPLNIDLQYIALEYKIC